MLKVMIVDDEAANLQVMMSLLRRHTAVEAIGGFTDPHAAMSTILETRPDVVFTDVEMPGMNGLELAHKILETLPETRFVFVTAFSQYAVDAFQLYAMDYMIKPVDEERLEKTLNRLVTLPESVRLHETDPLFIRMFGKMEVWKGNRKVQWKGGKTEELFAYLLHQGAKSVHKDDLVDMLWQDFSRERGLCNMQTALCRVRQSITDLGDHVSITYANNHYTMSLKNVKVDADLFSELSKGIGPVTKETLADAQNALAMYRGDYLQKDGYLWAVGRSELIRKNHSTLLIDVFRYMWENRQQKSARRLLQNMLDLDPENGTARMLAEKVQRLDQERHD